MPRKGHIQKREVMADPVYSDVVITKLINNVMLGGKKGTAQLFMEHLKLLQNRLEKTHLKYFIRHLIM